MTISNLDGKSTDQGYLEEGMDLKKLFLLFVNRIWIPIICIIVGTILGAACYFAYHAIHDGVRFQAVSKIYLDFAADETGEVYQYYNGYTWNDLMSTEPIITETMSALASTGLDAQSVEAATKAEILSDIRLLTITIECSNASDCEAIQKATEASLEKLGDTAKEFIDIRVVKSVAPKQIYADSRIKQACLLGALLGCFISISALWIKLLLDDLVYVPKDLKWYEAIPMLGVSFAAQNEFTRRMQADVERNLQYLCGEDVKAAVALDATATEIDYDILRKASMVVLKIPYGGMHRTHLEYVIKQLQMNDVKQLAFQIVDADETFYRKYFFGK